MTRVAAWLVLLFLVAPLLAVVPISFSAGTLLSWPTAGWSWRWYADLVHSERWRLAAWNSVVVGLSVTLLTTALGTAAAIGLHAMGARVRRGLLLLLTLPLVTPTIVSAVALYIAFARAGLSSTLPGLVLAHSVLALPYVVLTVLAALSRFDPALLAAAASLGAPPSTAARRVLLPGIAAGVVSGAVFAFAVSFDDLLVALFMAGPAQWTLPRQMYAGIHELLSPTICAAAVVLVAASAVLLWISEGVRR